MAVLPVPELSQRPNYWRRAWSIFRLFVTASVIGAVLCVALFYWLSPGISIPVLIRLSAAAGGSMIVLGAFLALLSPNQETWEETNYRRRLERAQHYYLHEDQLKADWEELNKTCVKLYAEGNLKGKSNSEIIQLTIDRARTK